MDKLLKVRDIANIIGCSSNKAYRLIHTKGFPYIKIGKNYYIKPEKLNEWLDNYIGKTFDLQKM